MSCHLCGPLYSGTRRRWRYMRPWGIYGKVDCQFRRPLYTGEDLRNRYFLRWNESITCIPEKFNEHSSAAWRATTNLLSLTTRGKCFSLLDGAGTFEVCSSNRRSVGLRNIVGCLIYFLMFYFYYYISPVQKSSCYVESMTAVDIATQSSMLSTSPDRPSQVLLMKAVVFKSRYMLKNIFEKIPFLKKNGYKLFFWWWKFEKWQQVPALLRILKSGGSGTVRKQMSAR